MTDLQRAPHAAGVPNTGHGLRSDYADVLVAESFGVDDLGRLREQCYSAVRDAGLAHVRALTFVWAINEGLVNAIQHGGGHGRLLILAHTECIFAEIANALPSTLTAASPAPDEDGSDGGHGLWIARRMVDHLTLTLGPEGTTLRLEIAHTR
jgi:serine/threonine-protein kinase RsbW